MDTNLQVKYFFSNQLALNACFFSGGADCPLLEKKLTPLFPLTSLNKKKINLSGHKLLENNHLKTSVQRTSLKLKAEQSY